MQAKNLLLAICGNSLWSSTGEETQRGLIVGHYDYDFCIQWPVNVVKRAVRCFASHQRASSASCILPSTTRWRLYCPSDPWCHLLRTLNASYSSKCTDVNVTCLNHMDPNGSLLEADWWSEFQALWQWVSSHPVVMWAPPQGVTNITLLSTIALFWACTLPCQFNIINREYNVKCGMTFLI